MLVLHALGGLALALAFAGIGYALAAAWFIRRLAAPAPSPAGDAPAVTLLKPLYGEEPGLLDNLLSVVDQDYPGPVQLVLGVQDSADPALEAVAALRRVRPAADIAVVSDPRRHGSNGKVSNLINMMAEAKHEVLVLSDADMRVGPDYLSRVTFALAGPGVGAVTCYYRGEARGGLWSQLSAMGVSYGFLANVALGVGIGLARPCMGSTIALRREVLDEIGGFQALADVLMDDYDIGRAVWASGRRVVLPPFLVTHGCSDSSFAELVAHELRWAVTVRMIDLPGHLGSVVTHAAPLALIGAWLLGWPAYALGALAAAAMSRLWLKASVDQVAGSSSGPWLLLPARDILSFAIFLGSLFARAVYWRGARFRVSSGRTFFPA